MGINEVRPESINGESSIRVVSGNMIPSGINVTKDISALPVFTLECDVFWIKLPQAVHYGTISRESPTKL
jgi:hypothetical protein